MRRRTSRSGSLGSPWLLGSRGALGSLFRLTSFSLVILGLVAPSVARADDDEEDRGWMTRKARVRDGLALGLNLGVGLAGSSGYPNDAKQIDRPEYYSSSNLMVGATVTPTLMGALTDYLNFGFMLNLGDYKSSRWESTGGGVGVRVEGFPMWTRSRDPMRNFGVFGQGGIGWGHLHQREGIYPDAEGVQSYFGGGMFHEFTVLRGPSSHLAIGPYAQYDLVRSRDFERHALTIGIRSAWYGGR